MVGQDIQCEPQPVSATGAFKLRDVLVCSLYNLSQYGKPCIRKAVFIRKAVLRGSLATHALLQECFRYCKY